MQLIIGLGNPGKKYQRTRHNAGFLFLDWLAEKLDSSFHDEKKFDSEVAEANLNGKKLLLVKPGTFMNNSGKAIAGLLQYYKISPADILVIHDDLDVPAGKYKVTTSSRSAGNNGVQNIIDTLKTQEFGRIRLGIGRPTETLGICQPSHDYVLSDFQKEEREKLTSLFPEVYELVKNIVAK